ncbi:MAG: hypothetical protein KJ558_15640 [Gammaproteobacteria bacterium]|nr:hypothetical protein [Gammaproteobacteria bacterium]MBU1656221.1 hypothetical protein [Gammaproteobacteria bacterium]MBU1959786.1 hypothetical protein [Gammaproteobacteria bacterium]
MDLATLHQAILAWAREAQSAGWLEGDDLRGIERIEHQQAAALFENKHHRPLLVGLFGGTGVGKSSLLNRLAGKSIARVGIERPTSHEVTLYLHRDFRLSLLPPELPVDQTRLAYHDIPERGLLAWLDMPDMDSTEARNRDLVVAWLPYLDWIVYVVSPERYQDDLGWRFLQQRGRRHAWLFVMNQWDRGRSEQLNDFRLRLEAEGFKAPRILRTSCFGEGIEDDFLQLEDILKRAIQNYGLELLQRLGLRVRQDELAKEAERLIARTGATVLWDQARGNWGEVIVPRLRRLERRLGDRALRLTESLRTSRIDEESLPDRLPGLADALWTETESVLLEQWNSLLLEGLRSRSLPVKPMQRLLQGNAVASDDLYRQVLRSSLDNSLAHPGSWLQRSLHWLCGFLEWLMPLSAAGWAAQHLVRVYSDALQSKASFLGIDFAVHSILLITLAWAIPWFLHRHLKPSPVSIVRRGLKAGIPKGSEALRRAFERVWDSLASEHRALLEGQQRITGLMPPPEDFDPNRLSGLFSSQTNSVENKL